MVEQPDLYAVLGLPRSATETEVRRAYRVAATRCHPDKPGGDAAAFASVQRAYDVLSVAEKRAAYDATGVAQRSADEELLDAFGGGKFRDKLRAEAESRDGLREALALRRAPDADSHTAGFDAWLRSKGDGIKVYTGDDAADEFGVNKSSYDAVVLPNIKAFQARCSGFGNPAEVLAMVEEPIPKELEWGEVVVSIRAAPISPGDLFNVKMGASPYALEADTLKPPFVAGNDGLAVVAKAGPGVKHLCEGDWVLPNRPGLGTWRSVAVWRERDVLKIPADLMPPEYAAQARELCTAWRLLEDHGGLRPGDGVLLNAANSTVGHALVQLCRMLKLRAVCVLRPGPRFEAAAARLRALGAAEVLRDGGDPLAAQLAAQQGAKFFAKPRLALDAVGGASAAALAEALADGCPLVVYGCLSGRAPAFPWAHWVHKDLQVKGFSLRRWMAQPGNKKKIPSMLEGLGKVVSAGMLKLEYTEYELSSEFAEALEHALEAGRNTKVLLRVTEAGSAAVPY